MCPLAAFNYVIKTMSVLKPVLFSSEGDQWKAFSCRELGLQICCCWLSLLVSYYIFFQFRMIFCDCNCTKYVR